MKEARARKYGRFRAIQLMHDVDGAIEGDEAGDWMLRFLEEFRTYSFEARKTGEPKNSGCVRELEGIEDYDALNPIHRARLEKEGMHLTYLKQTTSKRIMEGFLEELDIC